IRGMGAGVLTAALLALTPSLADPLPPVYHPQRLETIQASITVVGTVATTPRGQHDGDVTFELWTGSVFYHAEITCVHPPSLRAAKGACAGYPKRVPIPPRGERGRGTGPVVRDLGHDEQAPEPEIPPVVTPPVPR